VPDVEELLTGDGGGTGRGAADAAVLPDFGAIERRGRRRQRVVHGGVAVGAVVAVVAVAGLGKALGGDSAPPSPAPEPSVVSPTATDPVGSLRRPIAVAAGEDPDDRAVVWETGRRREIVFTAGGADFSMEETASATVEIAPDGTFVVSEGWDGDRLLLVDAYAEAVPVAFSDSTAPVADGELALVVPVSPESPGIVAVDTVTGEAHPVPMDVGGDQVWGVVAYDGRLAALTVAKGVSTYHWSDDGGATWEQVRLADQGFSTIVPTGAGRPHVVVEGGDGATVFPFLAVHTMPAGGDRFARVPYEGEQFAEYDGASLSGGDLVVAARIGDRSPFDAVGTFRFVDGDLRPVAEFRAIEIVDVEPDGTLWGTHGSDLLRSTDDGATWEPLASP
jgi:hypothetical protein